MSEKVFTGKIMGFGKDSVKILLENKNISCEKCGLCFSRRKDEGCFITLYGNYEEFKVGDEVRVFYSEKKGIQMAFLIFLLPSIIFLFFIFGGIYIGFGDFYSMLLGMFAVVFYFLVIKRFRLKGIVLKKM